MIISVRALAACFCFYSALYLVYAFFFKGHQPFFLLAAIGLFAGSWYFTPYSYEERQRQGFDSTLTLGSIFYHPPTLLGTIVQLADSNSAVCAARLILSLHCRTLCKPACLNIANVIEM